MTITPISALAHFPHGGQVEALQGNILRVYDRKAGGEGDRAWSMQDVELDDGTGKIKLVIKDQAALDKGWQGHAALWRCGHHGKTGKPCGLEIDDNEYNGKVTRRIFARPSSTMEAAQGLPAPQQSAPQQRSAPPPPPGHHQQSAPPPPAQHHHQAPPPQRSAPPPPAQHRQQAPQNQATQPANHGPSTTGPAPILGVTIGMAINNAAGFLRDILDKHDVGEAMALLQSGEATHLLYQYSSDILRVAQRLESGQLAPSPSQREERAKRAAIQQRQESQGTSQEALDNMQEKEF